MTVWAPSSAYLLGVYSDPTARNGYYYEVVAAGASAGTEPTWPTVPGTTVVDGSVTWQLAGFASYVDQRALEAKLSRQVVTQQLDDDQDGFPDLDNIQQILRDSASYCNGFFRVQYAKQMPFVFHIPGEVKRLQLEIAMCMVAERFPSCTVSFDVDARRERTRRELHDLAKGVTRLDVIGTPEPQANMTGMVASDSPARGTANPTAPKKVFIGGMGDF